MPFETISIVNKSGKVVSTVCHGRHVVRQALTSGQSKHLINIFKDAKDAYVEKKAEIRAEYHQKQERLARKLRDIRLEEIRSASSSRRSHRLRSHGEDRDRNEDRGYFEERAISEAPSRSALTESNLSALSEGSVASSRRSSHYGSVHHSRSPRSGTAYLEDDDTPRPGPLRRHTDVYVEARDLSRQTIPEYGSPQPMSTPHVTDDIDMHLAYGDVPRPNTPKEQELQGLMSRFDKLMIEAQCVQHSAATIFSSLQANPEAMAAVALTLAEISSLTTKMGPGILSMLKVSSPAIFALLASPQFLIATGVAVGVTIVMFGGYKIIKQIQQNAAENKEASQMEEALVFDGQLSSIESWRRGIADAEAESVSTSVDGEFITPEAMRVRKERIRQRAREERIREEDEESTVKTESVDSSAQTVKTVKKKKHSARRSNRSVYESYSTETTTPSELKKGKKPNALKALFKKSHKLERDGEKPRARSHKPRLLEIEG
jgi:hypothetical protein